VHSPAFLIAKHVQPSMAYDPMELAPVAQIYGGGASIVVVRGDSQYKSLDDLVARAKTAPGKVSYGSGGVGFPAHLSAESILQTTGTQALHVPYKSTAEYLQALIRGDTDFSVAIATSAMPLIRSGRLRAVAVMNASRTRDMPDVPTVRELLKNDLLVQEFWAGLAAAAKTPPDTIRALYAATAKALADPVVRKVIEAPGNVPMAADSPEAFGAFVRRENDRWRTIVKLVGIKPE
jgi:tripartite-type tricarboxylate transporter receptor subunit TctC